MAKFRTLIKKKLSQTGHRGSMTKVSGSVDDRVR